tara:strand:- start:2035 stop:2178 length:144 start_codon:yes stop_codon:yes gene_type:complete
VRIFKIKNEIASIWTKHILVDSYIGKIIKHAYRGILEIKILEIYEKK